MDWVMDLLPSAFHGDRPIREFTLCYLAEATEGQQLDLHWQLDPEGLLHTEGYRSEGEKTARIFAAQALF